MTSELALDRVISSRRGRLLLVSQALDNIGFGVMAVALPWLVLDQTGSVALAGFVLSLESIPYILIGPFAGAVADWVSPRVLMLSGFVTQAAVATVIPIAWLFDRQLTWVFLLVPFLVGTARVFSDAAVLVAVSQLSARERYVDGQAFLLGAAGAGALIGPLLGGLLVAKYGPAMALGGEVVAYLLAALVGSFVALRRARTHGRGNWWVEVAEGLRIASGNRDLRSLIVVSGLRGLGVGAILILLTPLLRINYELSSFEVGLVLAVGAGAGIGASLAVGALDERLGSGRLISAASLVSGAAGCALALSGGQVLLWIAVVSLFASVTTMSAALNGVRQSVAGPETQARVGMVARATEKLSLVVGSILAILASTHASLSQVYLWAGVGLFAVAIAVWGLERSGRARFDSVH